ncbi:MAG: hypothetical protein N3A38_00950 [Planctomycetota bacterium]|nr:hypothetical protein [Planctomycetota bacterium]
MSAPDGLSLREYLESCALSPKAAELFRNPDRIAGTVFDSELGYLPAKVVGRDGVDGCRVFYSFEQDGARRIVNYRQLPCRINTYGDSFTQCNQVSDGETWQEILAAHFGEPIRNYGVGGYGVYQAYLRMKRVESGSSGAPYVILNIYDDDHFRSLMACRWLHLSWRFRAAHRDNPGFHAMPWAHIRFDPRSASWVERPNPFATPESLCRLSDPAFVYETFRDDQIVKLDRGVEDEEMQRLAEHFGPEDLYRNYALASTAHIVERAREFARARGKKLMIVLTYSSSAVRQAIAGAPRPDQWLVDKLACMGLPIVDVLRKHVEDFQAFRLSPDEYLKRYYIGHYSPAGNRFLAFAIKDAVVAWLTPRPPAYDGSGGSDGILLDILADQNMDGTRR